MKIRNKTALRAEIKERAGNLGSLDNIWIDPYSGNWTIHGVGTVCPGETKVPFSYFYQLKDEYYISLDSAISKGFKDIEEENGSGAKC